MRLLAEFLSILGLRSQRVIVAAREPRSSSPCNRWIIASPNRGRRARTMSRVVTMLAALLLATAVAWAADIEGKVKTWDPATKMITLEDGTQLSVAADAKMMGDQVKEGSTVKASYDEKDGKKVVTQIEVKN
jgi:Cu/Ag efflux protein CusF